MSELVDRLSTALAARYRIEREVGHGGMAVVFLARDLRHDRPVAVKVLRPELAGVLGPQRFLREIQVAARLTHPHILPMLDSGEADGLLYYTMPFVDGETLRQRLERERQLPVEEALRIAREVADALDHAHRQGVVHRDVKPENVLLSAGHAVVADFGIAQAMEASGAPRLTTTGVMLGTPAYLSPEQAAGGQVAGARADQYALGCVVYEMLAGQPPFTGPTAESLVHQHLNVSPRAVTELRPAVAPALAGAVARVLAKNPADRFETATRFAEALVPGAAPATGVPAPTAPPAPRRRRTLAWAAGIVAAALLVAAATWAWLGRRPHGHDLELTRLTFDTGATFDPTISRDGKLFAYVSDRGEDGWMDLWVQQTGQGTPLRLTRDEAQDRQPTLSPDGTRIAFVKAGDDGGLYVVSALGGEPRRIADAAMLPHFSPDGRLVSFLRDEPFVPGTGNAMFLVSPDGGAPRPFQPGYRSIPGPTSAGVIWSPDGRHLMFYGFRPGEHGSRDWYVAPVDGGPAVRTGARKGIGQLDMVQFPCLWLPGHVVFAAGTTFEGMNLYRTVIHPGSWKVTGPVERLTSGPGMKYFVNMAGDGTLVLADVSWVVQIWSQALDPGTGLAVGQPARVTSDAGPKFQLCLSHDGSRLAYTALTGPRGSRRAEIHVRDLGTNRESSPFSTGKMGILPGPALDGRGANLTYQDDVGGSTVSFLLPAGATSPRELCRDCAVATILPASGDAVLARGRQRLSRLPLAGGSERDLVRLTAGEVADVDAGGTDQRLLVMWGRPGHPLGIHAVPVRDSAVTERDFVPLVEGPGWMGSPRWSPDGSRVYFLWDRDGSVCVWMQRVDRASGHPVGDPVAVLHNHRMTRAMYGPRGSWTLAVAKDRLYFNAVEVRSDVWQSKLDLR